MPVYDQPPSAPCANWPVFFALFPENATDSNAFSLKHFFYIYFTSDWLVAPADWQASLQLWVLFWSDFIFFPLRLSLNLIGFTLGALCGKRPDYSLLHCELVDGKAHSGGLIPPLLGWASLWKPWEDLSCLADNCSQVSTSKAKKQGRPKERKFSFQAVCWLACGYFGNVKITWEMS